ncbi:rhodanese-like domain-containing protein [Egicoccus sp. AB-alg2]|uniref:rhodanese-like domain-containing protein n=1 Tax=Egicoccus sp. AB-alg2 TaxID=3242693 RepID=UPI00359D4525
MTDTTTAPARPGQHLPASDLRDWLRSDGAPRVLDVRTPAEFESVHIPGAYNVPLDTLREHRDELVRHLHEEVVLVCRSGQRATQAERALAEAGLPHVHVLDGGMLGWEAAGGEVRRGRQRWDLERQVRLVAGGLVLSAGLGSLAVPRLKWLATAVGGGLVVAAVTNTCLMGQLLQRLPYNRDAVHCDVDRVVEALADAGGPAAR